jgi:type III pantothenate kinase
MPATHFIAADVGNARIKLGVFAADCTAELPEPLQTLPLLGDEPELDKIDPWLEKVSQPGGADIPVCRLKCGSQDRQECSSPCHWWLASVNRPAATRLIDWLKTHRPADRVTLLAAGDLPLQVRLERPDMVGIDRLVDALAVNRLRDAGRPVVIVDVGSAITVDLVAADGAFLGGAILPGIQMAARAMHEFTDLLPLVDTSELSEPPPALGTATIPAMQAGLFWGTVGAIRQLIEQLHKAATACRAPGWGGSLTATPTHSTTPTHGDDRPPQVFLTGGAGAVVAELLGPNVRYEPNLTLSGIALAAKTKGLGIRD